MPLPSAALLSPWRIVSGSMSRNHRRCQLQCRTCGVVIDRLYPYRAPTPPAHCSPRSAA